MKQPYWFKAKRYGYGWYPSSWQGWLVTLGFVVYMLGLVWWSTLLPMTEQERLLYVFPDLILAVVMLIIICAQTGEPPRWRWGDKK